MDDIFTGFINDRSVGGDWRLGLGKRGEQAIWFFLYNSFGRKHTSFIDVKSTKKGHSGE